MHVTSFISPTGVDLISATESTMYGQSQREGTLPNFSLTDDRVRIGL